MQLLSDGSILADSALVLNVCYQSPAVTVPQMLLASGKGTFSHFHLKSGRAGQELTSKAESESRPPTTAMFALVFVGV